MRPSIVKNYLFPWHERLLKRPTIEYVKELEKSQWLCRDGIELLQRKKLKELLTIAVDHCPWHQQRIAEVGIDISENSLPTFNDLSRLPTMQKEDAQLHKDEMVWRDAPGGIYPYTTGGSSGTPLNFYFGKWRQASDAAGRIRARRWWDIDIGDKEVYLWGAPVELNKTDKIKQIRDGLMNQILLNAFDMSLTTMQQYLDFIVRYKPGCIYGYASSIALLARFALNSNQKIQIPQLKAVFTTGEPLYPEQRKIIHEAFKVPVANEFGSRDIGFTAHQSPEGQMLLMSESHILEILDKNDQPVAAGKTGEAVITGLCSQAQPFIRYRTGDFIKATDESCVAGRGLHVLGEVVGRSTDFIIKKDGSVLHALAVIYVTRAIEGIESFKIIQHTTSELEVQVVPNALWKTDGETQIRQQMQQRLGEIDVAVNLLDAIPPEKSGKHRYVVSHVPLPTDM